MKGVFNLQPSKPRYSETWDAKTLSTNVEVYVSIAQVITLRVDTSACAVDGTDSSSQDPDFVVFGAPRHQHKE